MLLRVVDGEEFKDIRIEEGEMFLLPGRFTYSCFSAEATALQLISLLS